MKPLTIKAYYNRLTVDNTTQFNDMKIALMLVRIALGSIPPNIQMETPIICNPFINWDELFYARRVLVSLFNKWMKIYNLSTLDHKKLTLAEMVKVIELWRMNLNINEWNDCDPQSLLEICSVFETSVSLIEVTKKYDYMSNSQRGVNILTSPSCDDSMALYLLTLACRDEITIDQYVNLYHPFADPQIVEIVLKCISKYFSNPLIFEEIILPADDLVDIDEVEDLMNNEIARAILQLNGRKLKHTIISLEEDRNSLLSYWSVYKLVEVVLNNLE